MKKYTSKPKVTDIGKVGQRCACACVVGPQLPVRTEVEQVYNQPGYLNGLSRGD